MTCPVVPKTWFSQVKKESIGMLKLVTMRNSPPFSNEEFAARDCANSKNGFMLLLAWDKETLREINENCRARDVPADPGAREEDPPHPALHRVGEKQTNSVKIREREMTRCLSC